MRIIRRLLFVFIVSSFIFPVGEAGAIFLLIAPGAAAQGTGEAHVARVDDAYASYYNPASLAFQNKINIAGMHVNWLKRLSSENSVSSMRPYPGDRPERKTGCSR